MTLAVARCRADRQIAVVAYVIFKIFDGDASTAAATAFDTTDIIIAAVTGGSGGSAGSGGPNTPGSPGSTPPGGPRSPKNGVAWIMRFGGLMALAFRLARGHLTIDLRSPETWKAAGGGLVSLLAYGLVVTAFWLAPTGPVTALRETSVVFAALIGAVFLGERLTARRLAACLSVALGAILIGLKG